MRRTILKLSDFEKQAALILAVSRAKYADATMMAKDDDAGGDEDEGAPDDEDEDEDDPDDDDSDDKSDKKDKGKDKGKGKDSDDDDKVDRSEYDRVKRHRAAADRHNAELTSENQRLKSENDALRAEGKDGKLDEATTARLADFEKSDKQKDGQIHDLRIHNAFLSANDYQWHDPNDALRLADLRDVEIEDDGTVVGLKESLKKLAKEKPHLLKKTDSKSTKDKDDEEDDKKGPSGSANNGRRKGKDGKKVDRATLSKTYPVLATRR